MSLYDFNDSKSVDRVHKLLEENFTIDGCNIKLERTDEFCEFDGEDKITKVVDEVKRRNNKKNAYPTTMVGYNKVIKAREYLKRGYVVLFCFEFTDGVYYYQLEDENDLSVALGGRTDRGKNEIKSYAYIDVNKLIPMC